MTTTNAAISTAAEAIGEETLSPEETSSAPLAFTVYREWGEYISCLESDKEAGELFRALFAYAFEGKKENGLKGAAKIVFSVAKKQIDKEEERRRKRLEACAAAQKRKAEEKARRENCESGKNAKKEGEKTAKNSSSPHPAHQPSQRLYEIDINGTNQKGGLPPLCDKGKPPVFDYRDPLVRSHKLL